MGRGVVGAAEGADRPAKIVCVKGEVGGGEVGVPAFGEAVGLADFPAAAVSVGTVLPFDERRVDFAAARRRGQGRLHLGVRAENRLQADVRHPPFRPRFTNHRVDQVRPRMVRRGSWPAAFSVVFRLVFFAERQQNRLFIRLAFVAGDKPRNTVFQAFCRLSQQKQRIFVCLFSADDLKYEPMLGIQRHVIPAVAAAGVNRDTFVAAVSLLFPDEAPLFVELDFLGLRGKNRHIRREVPRHAPPPSACNGSPSADSPSPNAPFSASRSPRQHARGSKRPFSSAAGS